MEEQLFKHRVENLHGIPTYVIEAKNKEKQLILFLHGYHENWKEYEMA